MAVGDIGAALIDSLHFDAECYLPSIVKVSGDIYAIAYQGQLGDGWIATVEIDSAGNVTDPVVDSLEFDAVDCSTPTIIKIADTVFAIVYRGVDGDGFCKTITIANDGTLGAIIDTLEFETDDCYTRGQNFLHISGNIYAVAYQGPSLYLTVKTFDIDTVGNIGSVADTLSIAIAQNKGIDFINITGSVYAVAFQQNIHDTQVKTFTISDAGAFSAILDTATIDTASTGAKLKLANVSGDIFVLGYDDPSNGGKLVTMEIDNTGAIGAIIDTESIGASLDDIVQIAEEVFLLAYTVVSAPWLKTITIETDGQITTSLDTLQFEAVGHYTKILYLSSSNYIIVYTGAPSNDGIVATVDVANGLPVVTTETCESVVGATATGRGTFTTLGSPNPTAHGHCWAETVDPTTSDSSVDNGAASVATTFTSAITSLTPGTGYYTRAFATNTIGTAYGANVYFVASTGRAGYTWDESSNLRSFDENALERQYIHTDDVDDTPADAATTDPISSNWAYDHENDADAHGEPTITTDSGTVTADDQAFSIVGGEGIDTSGATTVVTIAGEDASTSNKGIVQLDDTAGGTNAEVAKPPTSNVVYDHGVATTGVHGVTGTVLGTEDVDDTPVNGATTAPASSNWAFDHVATADPHTGYRLESADHTHQTTGLQAGQLDHGLAMTSASLSDNDHTQYVLHTEVDDTPVDGVTTDPISSNWAFDHVAAADPHTGYVLESLFDTDTFLYASTDNIPLATSPANVLVALSGHAGATFDFNDQALTSVAAIAVDSINGIDYNPGSDTDADIITVGVTGTPRVYWDESETSLNLINAGFIFTLPAAEHILIDGRTNQRTETLGAMRWNFTPASGDIGSRAIYLDVNANSVNDTMGMVIDYTATGLVAGTHDMAHEINVNTSTATGGTVGAMSVEKSGTGTVAVEAIHVSAGVIPLHQESGTFGNLEQAWRYALPTPTWTDVTAACNSAGTDVELFTTNGDILYIGDAATFDELNVTLATVSSKDIRPTFEFSVVGGSGWTAFTPNDTTTGFRNTGVIAWEVDELTSWATATVNGTADKYWIRITRTKVGSLTAPIEDTIGIAATTEYGWDENSDLTIRGVIASGDANLYSGADLIVYSDAGSTEVARIDGATGNITTSGTVDGIDVSVHDPATTGVHGAGGDTIATDADIATAAAALDYGLSFEGIITTYTDSTHFKVSTLADKGTGFFKPVAGMPYEIYVVEADGAAPEGEQTPVVAYTTADGTFQHAAFTDTLAVGDIVLIIHPLIATLGTKATAAASGAVTTTDYLMAYVKQLVTAIQLIPTTMVGTDNAALASVLGALDTAAASGAVTTTDKAMAYIKQLVTLLIAQDVVVDNIHDTDLPAVKTDTTAIIADIGSAVPEPPTAKSLQDILHKDTNYTYSKTTDSLEAIADAVAGVGGGAPTASDWKGNFNWDTSAYTTVETDISNLFSTDLALTTRRKYTVRLDLTAVEADGNFDELYLAVKEKVNPASYGAEDRKTVTKANLAATAEPVIIIVVPATADNVQITMQMNTALAGDATIYYAVVKEHLE